MDFEKLKKDLGKSFNLLSDATTEKDRQIEEELEELARLLAYLMPVLPQVNINGKKAVLVYVWAPSEKRTIGREVYYCEDGKIRYVVFKKEEYQGYNWNIQFEGPFAVVEPKEMFQNIDLSDVLGFLVERIDTHREKALNFKETTKTRKQFLDQYKKLAKNIK